MNRVASPKGESKGIKGATNNIIRYPGRKLRHDRRKAKQRAKRKEDALSLRNERGIIDPTPVVAVKNIITKGRYLKEGKGFIINY